MNVLIGIAIESLNQAYFKQKELFEEGIIADLVAVGRGEDKATN